MKIVLAHNFYQQAGGEDVVFRAEENLLRAHGHEVVVHTVTNDDVAQMGKLPLLGATVWNQRSHETIRRIVRETSADVVHFHNTFPLISSAAYYAARSEGAAVVQTLHNFRLLCVNAVFYRDGKTCTDCAGGGLAWRGVARGCYRDSRAASAVTAAAHAVHRMAGTWRNAVDAYIALTESARERFVAGGLPAEKIVVKSNFVHPDPGVGGGGGGYAVFVGRLSPEKGVDTLLNAWRQMKSSVPLRIIGDGPLADDVRQAAADDHSITWLGRQDMPRVYAEIGAADLLILPSNCFETFGRVAVEAFAVGTPVLAAGHGAMADVVGVDGRLGALFKPGDAKDLAEQASRLISQLDRLRALRPQARDEFERKYTGDRNHAELMAIYRRAIEASKNRRPATIQTAVKAVCE